MRNLKIMLAAMIAASALIVTGCGESGEITMDMSDEKQSVITLKNAGKDMTSTLGTFVVEDNEEVVVEPDLEGDGKIQISFLAAPEEGIEEVPETDAASVIDLEAEGTENYNCYVEPGSYMLKVTVLNKSTGTVVVRTEQFQTDEYAQMSKVNSAEEAAAGAALDKFALPMDAQTDLGSVSTSKDWMNYRYMEGFAQTDFPMGAVDIVVRKGLSTINNGDVSGDTTEYTYSWTQDVNGTEAKCWGNKEGSAMKTIWTKGDYSYSITARGAGGEDDFGLSANDVAVWVAGVE